MKKYLHVIGPLLLLGLVIFAVQQWATVQSPAVDSLNDVRSSSTVSVSMPPIPTLSEQSPERERAISESAPESTQSAPETKKTSNGVAHPCSGVGESDVYCYENYYVGLIKSRGLEEGIPAAFADIKKRTATDSFVLSQCHPLTHVIGRIAAESFTDVAAAYALGDSLCWSGYYHGVLETFVNRIGLDDLETTINTMCASLNADNLYGFDYFNCVHGIGHGLMAITDDDIPSSLKYCDGLTGDWEQQSCAGGVYMENVIADGLNHATKWLDPARPHFPCDVSPEKYKNTCYLMQTSYMLKINGGDFQKTFEWCRDAGTFRDTCNQSIGRDASGRHSSDLQFTHKMCMLGENDAEVINCVIGAVKDFISYFHSDVQGKALCYMFEEPVRKVCLDTARAYYKGF